MKKSLALLLVILSVFLIACSKTEVVKVGETPSTPPPSTDNATQTPSQPPAEPSADAVPVKCDDTDLNDPNTVGKVEVTYSDGNVKEYYDQCNDIVLTEYVCDQNNAKPKNVICQQQCISVKVKDQESCPGCKVGACFDIS